MLGGGGGGVLCQVIFTGPRRQLCCLVCSNSTQAKAALKRSRPSALKGGLQHLSPCCTELGGILAGVPGAGHGAQPKLEARGQQLFAGGRLHLRDA